MHVNKYLLDFISHVFINFSPLLPHNKNQEDDDGQKAQDGSKSSSSNHTCIGCYDTSTRIQIKLSSSQKWTCVPPVLTRRHLQVDVAALGSSRVAGSAHILPRHGLAEVTETQAALLLICKRTPVSHLQHLAQQNDVIAPSVGCVCMEQG